MVYLTADLHGDLERLQEAEKKLHRRDTLIVLGDFGFLWSGDKAERRLLQKLGKRRHTLLFLDGAHENFDLLEEFPIVEYQGGRARKLGEHLYQLLRGECYTIGGHTMLCMGGGESEDLLEREEGRTWWRQELPGEEEMQHCRETLAAHSGKVDYILTHTPPYRLRRFLIGEEAETNRLETFLDEIAQSAEYRCWYFGRYHIDRAIGAKATAVYRKVLPMWEEPKKKIFRRREKAAAGEA